MPRLPTTRCSTRRSTILYHTMPLVGGIRRRIGCCPTSTSITERRTKAEWNCNTRRKLHCLRRRTTPFPIDMEINSLDPRHKHHFLPGHNIHNRLLFHPPPPHWHSERSPRHHSLAQDRFLCLHQSRPTARIPPSI